MRPMGIAAHLLSQPSRLQVSEESAVTAKAAMIWKAHSTPVSTRSMSAKNALAQRQLLKRVSAAITAMLTLPACRRSGLQSACLRCSHV